MHARDTSLKPNFLTTIKANLLRRVKKINKYTNYYWRNCIFCYIFLCMGAIIQANSNQQIIKLPSARYVGTKMKINYNFLYGYCLNCFIPSCLLMRIWCWCKRCKMIILSLFPNCSEMASKSNENISATQKRTYCWSFFFF